MIHLQLTSWCTMSCPECCCAMPLIGRDEKQFYDWAYFENAAKYFYGLGRVHVTGGEPTMHPQFAKFAPKLRALFGCRQLTIESNGHGFTKFPEAFRAFDEVYASIYTAGSFAGAPDNQTKIKFLQDYFATRGGPKPVIHTGLINFTPRGRRGTKMCHRGRSDNVAYAYGLVFPCCVGPGIMVDGKIVGGIPLTERWRQEILQVHIPCEHCWFAEP